MKNFKRRTFILSAILLIAMFSFYNEYYFLSTLFSMIFGFVLGAIAYKEKEEMEKFVFEMGVDINGIKSKGIKKSVRKDK